jgi:Cu/Ag efflux pump CusA
VAEGPPASNPVRLEREGRRFKVFSSSHRLRRAQTVALAVNVRSYAAFVAHNFFSLRGAILVSAMDQALRLPGLTNSWTIPIRGRMDVLATGMRTTLGLKVTGPTTEGIQRLAENSTRF